LFSAGGGRHQSASDYTRDDETRTERDACVAENFGVAKESQKKKEARQLSRVKIKQTNTNPPHTVRIVFDLTSNRRSQSHESPPSETGGLRAGFCDATHVVRVVKRYARFHNCTVTYGSDLSCT
jgi:hypothetical protein